ncbi:MAG: VacJ family lipoprotein [Rickettsiaceae bacterium H1]|nr:VacJ family lipoprotein [Rickettsiaceae bacterium H1]
MPIRFIIILFFLFRSLFSYALEIDNILGLDLFIEEEQEEEVSDPFENVNRAVFKFNAAIDKAILYPIARYYSDIKSEFLSDLIENFSNNLSEFSNFINAILQRKFHLAINAFWRFYINSTIGLAGLFEIAETLGMKKNRLSFENTLIFYGAKKGPYLVLPFYFPLSLRNVFASVLEVCVNPIFHVINNVFISLVLGLTFLISKREEMLAMDLNTGIDPYAKWRSIFNQANKI